MAGVAAEEKFIGKKIRGWGGNDYINAVNPTTKVIIN